MSGEIVGRGRFRVDRRRALDKMEKFQLEDPYRYVLELLAAARCAGATRVDVYNDSDDFIVTWDGKLPTRDELETLFDRLFGEADSPHGAMLQHLALGAIAANGLKPRWLRLDRSELGEEGGLRLVITNPTETLSERYEHDDLDGMRVHVREQLGAATIAEALVLFLQEPVEARLIRGAARWFPVPVVVNGREMGREQAPTDAIAGRRFRGEREGHLWLVPFGERRRSTSSATASPSGARSPPCRGSFRRATRTGRAIRWSGGSMIPSSS